ncbi:FecR family protein [Pedobacter rhizosphaerae]|uniref:FecR family protein n=2 Tax=Pedobacter rhizosphaerae TaxID=390241 RepID=A0A1H9STX5_9SPHI|nr:FecR family protein [Pedobacter rhizosphaerae]
MNAEKLLEVYHSGKATDEQKALVETWYLSFTESEHGFSHEELLEDKNKSLASLLVYVDNATTRRLWRNISVAASIFLVISAGLFFYLDENKRADHKYDAKLSDVEAGGNKATLTLADGKKIDLTSAANGNLAKLTGVEINKTADGQLVYTVKENGSSTSAIQYNTIETPNGGQYQVRLPDGTLVYLNAASSIKYPTLFAGKERKVEVVGEAYLEVAHNKNMPFKVTSAGQVIEVLGTQFNVSAYKDEGLMKTTLLQGSVKITSNGHSRLLVPGQQAQVDSREIIISNDINPKEVIAWKDGYFMFNENLKNIMNKIARWYNVDVEYDGNVDLNQEFGGRISRTKTLSSALKIMELTGNIHFKIDGRRVIVMK